MKKMKNGPAKNMVKQRAMRVLKQKKQCVASLTPVTALLYTPVYTASLWPTLPPLSPLPSSHILCPLAQAVSSNSRI